MSITDKIMSMVDVAGSKERFDRYKSVIERVLPAEINKVRYWAMYMQIAQKFVADPKVTSKKSIMSCMFNAVVFGLNPDPAVGHIYFIPYKGVLTYQLGYKGLIELAKRSGKVKAVRSGLVYKNDEWFYFEDEKGQHYRHSPCLLSPDKRGDEICAYSVFEDESNTPHIHVMPTYHIDEIKKMVLQRTPNSPWANPLFEPEMRKKTCTRRHSKLESWSAETARAIEYEESVERGEISKDEHPEIADIMDEIINKSNEQQNEPNPVDELFGKQQTIDNGRNSIDR